MAKPDFEAAINAYIDMHKRLMQSEKDLALARDGLEKIAIDIHRQVDRPWAVNYIKEILSQLDKKREIGMNMMDAKQMDKFFKSSIDIEKELNHKIKKLQTDLEKAEKVIEDISELRHVDNEKLPIIWFAEISLKAREYFKEKEQGK